MSKKIKDVSESIKSKLSFDDYTPSLPNEENKDVSSSISNKTKKVKRTVYIPEYISDLFDEFYAKMLIKKKKVDKSDIISQAILNLVEDEDVHIGSF